MTESEVLDWKLSAHLLRLMLDEKIAFERKKGKMDYLIRIGADVNKKVYGKSMAHWVKETNDEKLIKYLKENGGVEYQISKEKSEELGKQFWDENGKIKNVKEIKELVLEGADLSVTNNNDKQIWKNLSLEDMNEILKDLPKGYVIDGGVDLRKRGLTKLPDFSKIKVGGYFDCQFNQFTSLEGAPREVGRSFRCYKNQLTTLEGAPREVGGSFDCYENKLTTLKGAPEKVGGDFKCTYNQLTTLKGAPSEVGGGFHCYKNQLTTLEGAPSEVRGTFNCNSNKLKSLQYAPRVVGGNFVCFDNELITLEGKPEKIGEEFKIDDDTLARIEEAENKKKSDKAMMGAMKDKFRD